MSTTTTQLSEAIARYENAFIEFEGEENQPSRERILKLLMARDAVEEAIAEKTKVSEQTVARLFELDSQLQENSSKIAKFGNLDRWRASLNPPQSSWWWYFQPPQEIDPWDRLDNLWDTLTAAALIFTGSFMVSTFQAFSVGGLGVMETFGTLAQGAGLALVGKGALTSDGKAKVKKACQQMGIAPRYHSEVMFGFSAFLLLGAYGLNSQLPAIGKVYYATGQSLYQEGHLTAAADKYLQAIQLDPDNIEIKIALGEVYESLGDLDKALAQYKQAVERGMAIGFNHMGRVYIEKKEPITAETYLRMGLERVGDDDRVRYQLYRNLGWSLWEQKLYEQAAVPLEKAIDIDKKIPVREAKPFGAGMANCLFAETLERLGEQERANRHWVNCQQFALPETLDEYKWFMLVGKREVAQHIETGAIVAKHDRIDTEKVAVDVVEKLTGDEEIPNDGATAVEENPDENTEDLQTAGGGGTEQSLAPEPLEITDPQKVQQLRYNLYQMVDVNWRTIPTFNSDLIYRVEMGEDGELSAYEPMSEDADDFLQEVPLQSLPQSKEAEEAIAEFKVVFTPTGELHITPWSN
ncbi:tetratricopeptide repeat protein [Oxynema sp. CENA135]|uniref:tetratricopeptide repeat protein n=1 Tax=Oxynema sp. CENA135 TaxID=984206 RepID=UPI001909FE46|nr:tetratricopeptide repeat protein [Oxynema sp. CENA135]MBK4730061.1 tetratricopeptide repeat protein [Oxynema sp. CENA135]